MLKPPIYSRDDVLLTHWRILGVLGTGYAATVYMARSAQSRAAIKLIHRDLIQDRRLRDRFEREAQMLVELEHPGIVNAWRWGFTENKELYLLMELLDGQTLERRVAERGRLGPLEAISLFQELLEVLDFIHSKGIVHRDLKPENIMLLHDGGLRLMDFGIARRGNAGRSTSPYGTMHGAILGTPMYMSPEQARGNNALVDERSDLFTLGLILYQMLSGVLPRRDDTMEHALEDALKPVPPLDAEALGLPVIVEELVSRLCAPNRDLRFRSAAEVAAFVERELRPRVEAHVDESDQTIEFDSLHSMLDEIGEHDSTREHIDALRADEGSATVEHDLSILDDMTTEFDRDALARAAASDAIEDPPGLEEQTREEEEVFTPDGPVPEDSTHEVALPDGARTSVDMSDTREINKNSIRDQLRQRLDRSLKRDD